MEHHAFQQLCFLVYSCINNCINNNKSTSVCVCCLPHMRALWPQHKLQNASPTLVFYPLFLLSTNHPQCHKKHTCTAIRTISYTPLDPCLVTHVSPTHALFPMPTLPTNSLTLKEQGLYPVFVATLHNCMKSTCVQSTCVKNTASKAPAVFSCNPPFLTSTHFLQPPPISYIPHPFLTSPTTTSGAFFLCRWGQLQLCGSCLLFSWGSHCVYSVLGFIVY